MSATMVPQQLEYKSTITNISEEGKNEIAVLEDIQEYGYYSEKLNDKLTPKLGFCKARKILNKLIQAL